MAKGNIFAVADAGNLTFLDKVTKKPYLYVNYANSFEVSTKTDQLIAKKKGVNSVVFTKGVTGSAKLECELASMSFFSLITGSEITTGAGTFLKREIYTVAASMDFTLSETPATVLAVSTLQSDMVSEKTSFTVETGTVAADGKAIINGSVVKMYTGDVVEGDVLCVYYLYSEADVDKFKVVAKPKSSNFDLYADVAIKYEDGAEDFVQLHLFNVRPKEDLTFTFSSENVSKFSIELDVLPDSANSDANGNFGLYEWSQIN